MNHIHITPCTLFDFWGVLTVRNTIRKKIANLEFYFPSTCLELMRYFFSPCCFVCGVKTEKKLIAFSSVANNHGTFIIEDTVVLPDYWGSGMQREMWKYIISQIPEGSRLICTIHPRNRYCLDNALLLGFQIVERKNMYNSERYILELAKAENQAE